MNNCTIPLIIIISICSLVLCSISGTFIYPKIISDCSTSVPKDIPKFTWIGSVCSGALLAILLTIGLQSYLCTIDLDITQSILYSLLCCCSFTFICYPIGVLIYFLLYKSLDEPLNLYPYCGGVFYRVIGGDAVF